MTLMPQRWMTFFVAAVLVTSLACGEVLDVEDAPVSSNATDDTGANSQPANSDFELTLDLAEQGDADAQFEVGVGYATGVGVPQNFIEAVRLYRLAADQGNADAQYNLGVMYENGEGVLRDDVEAVRLYRLAADQGHADAQTNLGRMYAEGWGVAQEEMEALRWWRLAADSGISEAQFNVGAIYANGSGVPRDDVQAHMWFVLAAARQRDFMESRDQIELRDRVSSRLTPDQRAEALRLAREWNEAHPR